MIARLSMIAPIVTPLAPAAFFGHSAYMALFEATGLVWLSVVAGIATAAGLEMVGILAGHTAIEFWRFNDRRAWLAALLLLAYIAIGTVELWHVPVGRAVFLIAGLAYIVVGLRTDAAQVSANLTQESAEDRKNAQELATLRLQYQHEEKLARIQAQAAAQSAQAASSAAQTAAQSAAQSAQFESLAAQTAAQYVCACGKSFAVPQSYSAHRRHCTAIATGVNGHG